jgi:cellulose synthase/poly-beta-1,6-N-acetylglucosamine synthase-like glycosyltransferase
MLSAVVVASASLLILYVLAGYPLLLGLLARRRARPVRRGPIQPSVSIIVAVHNGERFIEDKLCSILALDYPRDLVEVIVASDGSTDRTDELVMRFAGQGVSLLRLPRGGKPAALNAAIPSAHGEILVLTDVRQHLDPSSVALLVRNFADPAVGVASGELVIRQGKTHEEANIGLYWRFESWIRDRLSLVDSMFGATGPFYAIRRALAFPMPPETLLDDMYLPLAAFFRGYRLVADPRARAYDYPTSLETEFHRKVRTLAGNYQILLRYPALLGPGNRMWFHFVSYKLGRLLLPWLLIVVAVASWGLPAPWRAALLAGQGLFYGIAAVDIWIPRRFFLKRVSSPIHTFVVMMIAAIGALSVFFVPARSLWKVTSAGKLAEDLKPDAPDVR